MSVLAYTAWPLENCCYGRYEMAMYNMIKKGVFGEVVYVGGGYEHDLRGLADSYKGGMGGYLSIAKCRNGELYPTHELGPMLYYLDINRGNRMLSADLYFATQGERTFWIISTRGAAKSIRYTVSRSTMAISPPR